MTKKGNLVCQNGTYRFPHLGHFNSFENMLKLSRNEESEGYVFVFIDSQKRVNEIKPTVFCMSDEDRMSLLNKSYAVTQCFIFNSIEDLQNQIFSYWKENKNKFQDLIYCKGSDYENKELNMKEFIESLGGRVELLPYEEKYSSTKLIQELQGQK